ncbi:hypothetical protein GH714_030008 [Hevea brasiliensis]|uniref:F-box protein n=1 Tax=Hevea brasiliensis TaxID=3981 RepID=A0A6A6LP17_HEVBR|nr:hypothetical protein GH714_030008 [Hevea brasiliensis]
MSDRVVKSENDKDKIPEKCLQPHKSIWMSHWTHTSYRSVNDIHNQLSHRYESGEDSCRAKHHPLPGGPEMDADSSKFVKEFRKMHNNSFMNESSKLKHETFKGQHFPMFKSSQNRGGILSLKNVDSSSHHGVIRSQIGPTSGCDFSLGVTDTCLPSMLESTPSKIDTQSTGSHSESGGTTSNPEQQVKSNKLLENNGIAFSAPLKDEFMGSTSRVMPSEFNSGRTPTEFFFHRQDIDQPSGTFFVDEKEMNSNPAPLMHNPSTNNNCLRDFDGEQFQKMLNNSDGKLFPNQIRPPEATLFHGSYEPPRIPSSVHDVKTMKICTTIDSVKEFFTGPSKFAQTTHHFLFTKKTDVNLSDGVQTFRESMISTKIEGKPTIDLKNESSAETHTMDMDTLPGNHLFGVASSLSNKDIEVAQKSPISHTAIASDKEGSKGRLPNVELPDINQELPVVSGVANSADDAETSTSRTQSLDVEHFLSYAEHPTNLKSSACADSPLGLDPYSRWVKRLKPSASESFAHGTKRSKMGEASSHEKVNKFFSKILNCSKTSSDPKMGKSSGKKQMVIDQTAESMRNAESSSSDSVRKSQDITLSHAWIQRWCHKPASSSKKKPEAVVICQPQSSNATVNNFQKKQFPSIAAMALMGKAMTSFRPCEFRKRGSFVVWNTRGLG